jgi:glycogen debranching enzyme
MGKPRQKDRPPVQGATPSQPDAPGSTDHRNQQKRRVLTRGMPASTLAISEAVVVKDADVFMVTERSGGIPLGDKHGFGLYHHDCRYLDGYVLEIEGTAPEPLVANADAGFKAVVELTNLKTRLDGGDVLRQQEIGIRIDRLVDGTELAVHDVLTVRNFAADAITVTLTLRFRAEFQDVYQVRGLLHGKRGTLHDPSWEDSVLRFAYDGVDEVRRSVDVRFWHAPDHTDGATAQFVLELPSEHAEEIALSLELGEEPCAQPRRAAAPSGKRPELGRIERGLHRTTTDWRRGQPEVKSSSYLLAHAVERSLLDLRMLQTELDGEAYFAAGVPWFVALFGRDSLLSALQALAFEPAAAASTLRLLARHQGTRVDAWRDEQPGKILHELRVGELARSGEVPHTPYYGSVDSTELFLVLMARHAAWTGSLALFEELREHVDAALGWIGSWGDLDEDGYLEYAGDTGRGLVNQGWKDSGDAIVTPDGQQATPPIALCEVQGYVHLAKVEIAALYERAGEHSMAEDLRNEAAELRRRFNRDFWMPDRRYFALALQFGKEQVGSIASNAGQALWTGIVDPDKARPTVERLMSDAMWTGWGIRTLSEEERRYNPIAYHRGTTWPHDCALIADGFRRYGFDDEACRVFQGLLEAARQFPSFRLPEVFSGFPRGDYGVPVRYPVACHPQAWAAGSVLHLLVSLLGLAPNAFERTLRIERPVLPDVVPDVELRGLRVGDARVDLRFERGADGHVDVEVLDTRGHIEVVVERGQAPGGAPAQRGPATGPARKAG